MINRQSQARGKFANRKKLMKKFARIILRIILTIFHFIMCRIERLYVVLLNMYLSLTALYSTVVETLTHLNQCEFGKICVKVPVSEQY